MLSTGMDGLSPAFREPRRRVLAAEYPDKFDSAWEKAPEFIYRGTQIFTTLTRVAERFADEATRHRAIEAFRDISREYAR